MSEPLLSIVIPTYDRAQLLHRAVGSALAQTLANLEVLVVDDGSPQPVDLPHDDPRLRILRLPRNVGGAAARNAGARAAVGRWITYLDDDDELLPHMAEVSLNALRQTQLPAPVAVLSALEVVRPDGSILSTRVPPTLLRGAHFALEEIPAEQSFHSKATLVVPRDVLLRIGGFDESFRSRVHTEFFLRLNPECSILGLPTVTYRLRQHAGTRVSQNPLLRQESFQRLLGKHESVFRAHPRAFARFLTEHARASWRLGQRGPALLSVLQAVRLDPARTVVGAARHARGWMVPRRHSSHE